jgi:hypothetical protein
MRWKPRLVVRSLAEEKETCALEIAIACVLFSNRIAA